MSTINGEWVNSVLRAAVVACPKDENVQLTVLTRALVIACKACGVSRDKVIDRVGEAYDNEPKPTLRKPQ